MLFEIRIARFSSGNPWSTAPRATCASYPRNGAQLLIPSAPALPPTPSLDYLRFCPISKPQDAAATMSALGDETMMSLSPGIQKSRPMADGLLKESRPRADGLLKTGSSHAQRVHGGIVVALGRFQKKRARRNAPARIGKLTPCQTHL